MSVNVRIPMILRSLTDGRELVSAEGASLQDVITSLDINYSGIGQRLLDDAGLRRFMHVYLNDQDVRFLDGLDTDVAVGDSVTILPAAADGFLA
ncbi:MAG: MoaD/ThiS family protein [Candidatus Nanopelagicales bacterium]|nr:MoaD/ThiS family protein [Candidatus Nanopelagicales bacterium]